MIYDPYALLDHNGLNSVLTIIVITMYIMIMHMAYALLCFTKVIYQKLTLNVWGPSYLGLTRSISLRRQDISSHGIDYKEYVGPGLT